MVTSSIFPIVNLKYYLSHIFTPTQQQLSSQELSNELKQAALPRDSVQQGNVR